MTNKQLAVIENLKAAIKAAEEEGIFLELDPETSDLMAGVKKENVADYVCVNLWDGEDFDEDDNDEYENCTYDDIFETVTLCDCSQKDDDDDVEYYVKYE